MSSLISRLDRESHPIPTKPTAAHPGTEKKIAVMLRRVANGEQPHHPLDAKILRISRD